MDVLDIGNGWLGGGRVGECDCMRVTISGRVIVRVFERRSSGRVVRSVWRWRLVSFVLFCRWVSVGRGVAGVRDRRPAAGSKKLCCLSHSQSFRE